MGLINDLFEDSLPGVVIGAVATAILLPLVGGEAAGAAGNGTTGNGAAGTAARGRGRQLMKAAVRGYVTVADRIKEATAEAREQMSDLAAEVREERRMQAETQDDQDGMESESKTRAPSRRKSSHSASSHKKHEEDEA